MRPKRASAQRSAMCLNSIRLIFMQAHKFGSSTNMDDKVANIFAFFPFHLAFSLLIIFKSSSIDPKAFSCSCEGVSYISGQLKSFVLRAIGTVRKKYYRRKEHIVSEILSQSDSNPHKTPHLESATPIHQELHTSTSL